MKVLVLGGSGMLGHEMLRNVVESGFSVSTTLRNPSLLPKDLTQALGENIYTISDAKVFSEFEKIISAVRPDVVVNCIGVVKQSHLSMDSIESLTINSLLPHKLNEFANVYQFQLIHISTDCVFSGNKGFYVEEDSTDAEDLYGKSKQLGEVFSQNSITLRTSIIGHELSNQPFGLVEWFLKQEKVISGYTHAIFSGLTTSELSKIILEHVIPKRITNGLYHVALEPINKHDLLKLIAEIYGIEIKIHPVDQPRINRSLNGQKFNNLSGYCPVSWEKLIKQMYDNYKRYAQ